MEDILRDVITKLKAQQQSKAIPIAVAPIPTPTPVQTEEEEDDEDEEMPVEKEKAPVKPSNEVETASKEQVAVQRELMLLQDNGIFRQQLLHQLQELNSALVVVADILVDKHGRQ